MTRSVVLVGLGRMAMGYDLYSPEFHVLTHARAFSRHPGFQLVGGVDPDPESCQLFSRRFGAAASGDLVAILASTQPDVVVVASPTVTHLEVVKTVLACVNPQAILCEKPLDYREAEARMLVELCKSRQCELYVNYPRRANPGVSEVKCRIEAGLIPLPLKGVVWYTKGLLQNGSHFLDLLEYWLGPIVGFDLISKGRWLSEDDPEPDVRFDFPGGSVIFLAAQEEHYSLHEVDLVSLEGRLRYLRGGSRILWHKIVVDPIFSDYRQLSEQGEEIEAESEFTQGHVVATLADMLDGQKGGLCRGEEALVMLEWLIKVRSLS